MEAINVGIDVSKEWLDVHVLPAGQALHLARDAAGLHGLAVKLAAIGPARIVLEATGGLEMAVVAVLAAEGLPVVVVNPKRIRHYAGALAQEAKTDAIDAAVIARFAADLKPEIRPLPDPLTRQLAELVIRRRQITEMLVAERLRLAHCTLKRAVKSIERIIQALERELKGLDGDIHMLVEGSPVWRAKDALMTSVPGIGPGTARVLIAQMPELGSLRPKQVAALAGLAPHTRKSGKWKGKSFIAGGREPVRSALFIATLSALRFNPIIKLFYERLLAAGKPKMKAIIACAHKLLLILNAIVRDNKPWQHA